MENKGFAKINNQIREKTRKDFDEFKRAYEKGLCGLCSKRLDVLTTQPCVHWLLNPKGFKPKKHFSQIYEKFSFVSINSYLRWTANLNTPFKNINDLTEENNPEKIIEETIKYKNLEWAFSCGTGDYKGNAFIPPHYHFQMKCDGKVIIKFNKHHIPFTPHDIYMIEVKLGNVEGVANQRTYDAGMNDIMNIAPDKLLEELRRTENEEDAAFEMSTMITSEEGIPGDLIADLMEESKRTGIPLAELFKRIENIKQTTFISPSKSVAEASKRIGGRGKLGK